MKPKIEKLDWKNIPALEEIVDLQQRVWNDSPRNAVPSHLLAIAQDTGGMVLVARNKSGQALGFLLALGTTQGELILHQLGVAPNARSQNIGLKLCLTLFSEAQKKGITKISWTFDPLRSANANLYLEKLGSVASKYTINKYGKVASKLYGENPTDRLTCDWDITSPEVSSKITMARPKTRLPTTLQQLADLPIVTEPIKNPKQTPDQFLVEIPYDIDQLEATEKTRWRWQLREILTSVLETDSANQTKKSGTHKIIGLVIDQPKASLNKKSYYLIRKKNYVKNH